MPIQRLKQHLEILPINITLPEILSVIFFIGAIFGVILPHMEENMMDLKRQMIHEITETAWSALSAFEEKERSGQLTREEAQSLAVDHLRKLRYGTELKDYFWINDMHPRLIMHPYRTDLEGKDITDFKDPNGKRLFVHFVETVRRNGAGFVDYEWQWMDDPTQIVPKISYVKGFSPWGWIIGTGIYIEDIRAEIASITRKIFWICLGILAVIVSLSTYIIIQGIQNARQRRLAEKKARLHQEQLFQASKMASLGTLVSGVAHEINNPIMSVMLNAPILKQTWETILPILDDHCKEAGDFMVENMSYSLLRGRLPLLVDNIEENARRVKRIVSDLKDFARQDTDDMADLVDINSVAKKAVSLVDNLIKKSTDHFSEDFTEPLPAFAGNAQRIEQVIINLLVNACQALPDKTRPIRIVTGHDADKGTVFLEVQDQGNGIPDRFLERIRDPFFTTKRESGGTGLGLSISDRIMEDHGGDLRFLSETGQGCTVRMTIPLTPKEDTAADHQRN